MKKTIVYLLLIPILSGITSCRMLYPSRMLRAGKGFEYTKGRAEGGHDEYRIGAYDVLTMNVYPNNGEKIFSTSTEGNKGGGGSMLMGGYTVNIERDGKVKLPIFGRIQIGGLTIKEAEGMLEGKLSAYFKDPFVQIKVSNKRVFMIYSSGMGSRVVQLVNDNTTIFEVLAESGGIGEGKAYRIKLIRGDLRKPQVYVLDLSTIRGVVSSDLVLQGGDIIYVEVPLRVQEKLMTVLTPYMSLLSTVTLLYYLFTRK